MTRLSTLILALMLCLSSASLANDIALTGKTLIDSDVVTVGDIFTNTGSHASHVLAPAPKAEDTLVLSKFDLERIAKAFRLNWKAPEFLPSLVLERNASLVSIEEIIHALNDSNLKNQIKEDAKFTLKNILEPITVAGKEPVDLTISKPRFDQKSEEFSATLEIRNSQGLIKEIVLQGIATPIIKIPVLRYPMPFGSVISAKDITEIDLPKTQLRGDMILFKSELVGMTLRRGAQANHVLSQNDITPPIMVKRNELVTVIYKNGAINLSTKARALSAGTRGDVINFINLTSKKPFEAKVTGPQQAEVNLDG